MANNNTNALVLTSPDALAKVGSGPKRILSGMVSDALAMARANILVAPVFHRIGDYEFCNPDYRQILIWAEALELTPAAVCAGLAQRSRGSAYRNEVVFEVVNGRIKALVWNFNLFPIKIFDWVENLLIEKITFRGKYTACLSLRFSSLKILHIESTGFNPFNEHETAPALACTQNPHGELDLSNVPNLVELRVSGLQLTILDISNVPNLIKLHCGWNKLTALNLTNVPKLEVIECHFNNLEIIDLGNVPNLAKIQCDSNKIAKLNLSNVPRLEVLSCHNINIEYLDLSNVPRLKELTCSANNLTEINLVCVPDLKELYCHSNNISKLDTCYVLQLKVLDCRNNNISELDITILPVLEELSCYSNQLLELDISKSIEFNRLFFEEEISDDMFSVDELKIFSGYSNHPRKELDWPKLQYGYTVKLKSQGPITKISRDVVPPT